jgi:hypothetical protein
VFALYFSLRYPIVGKNEAANMPINMRTPEAHGLKFKCLPIKTTAMSRIENTTMRKIIVVAFGAGRSIPSE